MTFIVEPLGKHDRSDFSCGEPALDRYLNRQASQDVRRRVSACFVAVDQATEMVAGYYTLSAADIPVNEVDPSLTRRLPRYPTIPAARLGRLAVDTRFHGRKLGAALLADAVARAARNEVAVFAIVVDAKNEAAAAYYQRYRFVAYGDDERQLIAPLTH